MAETIDITSIHGFSGLRRGVEAMPGKGSGLSDCVDYEVLMLSPTGCVDRPPLKPLPHKDSGSDIPTDGIESD